MDAQPLPWKHLSQSRQADQAEAGINVSICAQLGLDVASWKGNALAVYFSEREEMLNALLNVKDTPISLSNCEWKVRADDISLRERLQAASITLDYREQTDYIFHRL